MESVTRTFEIIDLFELTFVDNTKLWASVNCENGISKNDTICFGTLGNGINLEIKKLLEKDKNKVCYVAEKFSENKNIVKNYINYVELKSNEYLNQLTHAF